MSDPYVNLHAHTSYSQLDGASKIPGLVQRHKEFGAPAVCISDHGNLNGIVELYKECKKQDVKPILGQEFYFTDDRLLKESVKQENASGVIDGSDKRYYHLTVLAKNNDGYHNLLKLSSDAFINGMWYKPRSDYSMLEKHSDGIIVGTGCLGGPVLQPLLHENYDVALSTAARLQDIVGKDNMFVELMDHGLPEQRKTNPWLIDIARKLDAPIVATMDSHYTHKKDAHSHSVLLCQPPGTMVEVVRGTDQMGKPKGYSWSYIKENVPIENVKVGDRVTSWKNTGSRSSMKPSGSLVTKIGSRYYDGELIRVVTESGLVSEYTSDHICITRIGFDLRDGNYITYMQERDGAFRIGTTTYQKPRSKLRPDSAVLGILTRAKEQNAEKCWILSIHETLYEAREEEAYISWKYNIPTWSFCDVRKKGHEPRTPYYKNLWERVGNLQEKAEICLKDFGRDIKYPFWDIKEDKPNQIRALSLRAMNLESGMKMCVPRNLEEGETGTSVHSPAWETITVERVPYSGMVFSMDVEGEETYVADGIVTHNCCQTGSKLSDPTRFHFHNDEYYVKSPQEMRHIFKDNIDAIDNTLLIAENINVEIDFDTLHLPKFPLPEGYDSDYDLLEHLAFKGLRNKFSDVQEEYAERLAYELGVIRSLNLSSYFLIFWDLVAFAEREKILTGPGRGSAAGSLVSYALGITKLDPIQHNLLFERFINPDRMSLDKFANFNIPVNKDDISGKRSILQEYSNEGKLNLKHVSRGVFGD